MTVTIVLSILFIHWFADFVCQTQYQAENKSKSVEALLDHTITYSVIWFFVGILYSLYISDSVAQRHIEAYKWAILFPCITFAIHTITDFWTSKLNTYLWNKKDVHNFFVSVGFDQWLHYLQLFLTYYLLTAQ